MVAIKAKENYSIRNSHAVNACRNINSLYYSLVRYLTLNIHVWTRWILFSPSKSVMNYPSMQGRRERRYFLENTENSFLVSINFLRVVSNRFIDVDYDYDQARVSNINFNAFLCSNQAVNRHWTWKRKGNNKVDELLPTKTCKSKD